MLAFVLTYLSLFHQKYTLIDRIVVDKLGKVEVIGGGFPLQFLVDGEISPGGSIALDPLNIIEIDQFIFLYFILDYLFWLMCLLVGYAFFRKIKVKL
ncbi:hypothetical protein N5J31_16335 [Acinetobacter johnsonii]|uniref:hypothetical protein n=1 Tax=Acinetobacter johnsonii TaxID=40214 RepID=UPI00244C8E2F|nr:hypothetical protein [Acinetobacter johnsonii]MDH2048425.1 hypothetical protein [Acinetobacter johnsonii]